MNVLIIDDSHYMSRALTHVLESDKEIKVVAVAVDGEDALHKIEEQNPDVILLDIDMPGNEGPDVLAYLMAAHPVPVIILSKDSEADRKLTIRYLKNGAVDF
ncbi:MAG: response regulator [Nitrospirae bacterium]|nr:response regulator [Nitrospirota bacterium]